MENPVDTEQRLTAIDATITRFVQIEKERATTTKTKKRQITTKSTSADPEVKAVFGLMTIADQLEVLATAQKKMAQCVRLVGAGWTDVAEIQRMSNELAEAVRLATLWNEQMPDIQPDETYPVTTADGRTMRCTVPPSNNE